LQKSEREAAENEKKQNGSVAEEAIAERQRD